MDARERLGRHLYPGALDLSPEGVIALRIGHPDGLRWEVSGDLLGVWIADSVAGEHYDLNCSIAQLASTLAANGIEIRYANPDVLARGAACLVAGKGDATNDRLVAYQSNLWALLDAYGVEIRAAELNLGEALKQLDLSTSEGEFADFWGEFFGVPRRPGEHDADYRKRMADEVVRPRNNAFAIQNTIKEMTGHVVSLREPWREIFTLNVSELSGSDHLQDGSFFTWNVFQPVYHSNVTPTEREEILAIIERNRPAGCIMVGEYADPPLAFAKANFAYAGGASIELTYHSGAVHYRQDVLSSSLVLSEGRTDFSSELLWSFSGVIGFTSITDAPLDLFAHSRWSNQAWPQTNWRKGSVLTVVTQSSA